MTTPHPPQAGPPQGYPGQPVSQPAQPGYPVQPNYPGGPGQPPAEPPKKKRRGLRIALQLVIGAVVFVLVGAVIKFATGDPDIANVGDCMSGTSADDLKVVKCTEAGAQYKIVGKVEDKTQSEFNSDSGSICKAFPTAESAFWKGEEGGKGYVLCLGPNK